MSEPIVFISKQRIREGKLDQFKQMYQQTAEFMESNRPGTVAFLAYLNEDGTEASLVHVFPDADVMGLHMQGVGERASESYEFMEPVGIEVYGQLSDQLLAGMKQAAGPGVGLTLKPHRVGGYIRLQSG